MFLKYRCVLLLKLLQSGGAFDATLFYLPVTSERCRKGGECIPFSNNESCIIVHQNTANFSWFYSATQCEEDGGRLLWLHDTNVTDFTNGTLRHIMESTCSTCNFFWIGLIKSLYTDNRYFWKGTQNGL